MDRLSVGNGRAPALRYFTKDPRPPDGSRRGVTIDAKYHNVNARAPALRFFLFPEVDETGAFGVRWLAVHLLSQLDSARYVSRRR